MTCYDVDLVAFNFSSELQGWLFGIHSQAQGLGHVLNVVLVQVELSRYLLVRQIQAHQVKAQYPDPQRLMVAFEDGSGKIVEVGATTFAMVPLASRLGLIMSESNNLAAAATGAPCTVWPPDVANGFKAFGIIDQVVDPDKESIALASFFHGLSFR